jgi:hypothetical protein
MFKALEFNSGPLYAIYCNNKQTNRQSTYLLRRILNGASSGTSILIDCGYNRKYRKEDFMSSKS